MFCGIPTGLSASLTAIFCLLPFLAEGQRSELDRIASQQEELADFYPSLQTHQRIGHHGYEEDLTFVTIDFQQALAPEKIALFPARLPLSGDLRSPGFPSSFVIEISSSPEFPKPIRLASWTEPEPGAGEKLPFLVFRGNGAEGRFLRIRVTGLRKDEQEQGRRYFRLGEVAVLSGGRNVALKKPVLASAALETPRRWEPMNLTDGYFWCLPLRGPGPSPTNGFQSGAQPKEVPAEDAWVEVDLGTSTPIDEIHLVPAHPRELPDSFGFGFPPRFYVIADAGTANERVLLREVDPPYPAEGLPNPGAAQVTLALDGLEARTIRFTSETLDRIGPVSGRGPANYVFALSELQVWRNGRNLALEKPVRFANTTTEGNWSPEALVDGYSSRHLLLDWDNWLGQLETRQKLEESRAAALAMMEQVETRKRERILSASIAAAVLAILLSVILFLVLRHRAEHSREALRNRIARDLHDEIGASLSHLAMQSDLARGQLDRGELAPGRLERISTTARETLDNMRDIIWLLAPTGGDWSEFSDRLVSISDRLLDGVEKSIEVSGSPPPGEPPIEWARETVSILKEAITNARKHSQAERISVVIKWSSDFVMTITDNGVGFVPEEISNPHGSGLKNMRARAAALQGKLAVQSTPSRGTTIHLQIPMPS